MRNYEARKGGRSREFRNRWWPGIGAVRLPEEIRRRPGQDVRRWKRCAVRGVFVAHVAFEWTGQFHPQSVCASRGPAPAGACGRENMPARSQGNAHTQNCTLCGLYLPATLRSAGTRIPGTLPACLATLYRNNRVGDRPRPQRQNPLNASSIIVEGSGVCVTVNVAGLYPVPLSAP